MIWITVQVMIIPVSFLQPTLFGLGLVILALSASIAVRRADKRPAVKR